MALVRLWLDRGRARRSAADPRSAAFARSLAAFLVALQRIDASAGPAPGDHNFHRGAPLDHYDRETRESISLIAILTAAFTVLLSTREPAVDQAGSGEYHALLLGSAPGMVLLAQAQNLVSFFVAIETLSIPLYILCATDLRGERSLESGLKYLIVGSLGSATLLYGMALLYGGSGSTDFAGIAEGIAQSGLLSDPLVLIGIAMAGVGLAFKTSVAPFHQWTPDVYQGAPTPVTSFMAVATKAAAFAVFIRFFDIALAPEAGDERRSPCSPRSR